MGDSNDLPKEIVNRIRQLEQTVLDLKLQVSFLTDEIRLLGGAKKSHKDINHKLSPAQVEAEEENFEIDDGDDESSESSRAFMRPLTPSAALAEIIGFKPIARAAVVKKVWAYIKKNGLQDTRNRRNINCDTKLKAVFGKSSVSMFEMTKLLSKHLR